jgi:hypothetical protein
MKDTDIEAKIDDLAQIVARGFAEQRTEFKNDLADLREEFKGDMIRLRGDIDIMLYRHIGTFRKDYDDLASRVKRLEQLVLK